MNFDNIKASLEDVKTVIDEFIKWLKSFVEAMKKKEFTFKYDAE